jgi:site-specific recombinase XerD
MRGSLWAGSRIYYTVATMLLEDGAQLNSVQELLGHYNPAFTATQYGHVTKRMRKETTERLGNMLQAAKKKY